MDLPPDAAALLDALLAGVRDALADNLVGLYLRGSLVMGDFDPATSDLDFLAATERPISDAEFAALAALHTRLGELPNQYANQLEGPYIDRAALCRFRPGQRHPTIGRNEALARTEHGANWVLERWVVREHGAPLHGPDPRTLIDPISADELRAAVRLRLPDWADFANRLDDPDWLLPRAHNAYVVETMCRALATLANDGLPSKLQAVAWALEALPEPWRSLVERSRRWRDDTTPDPADVSEVRRFVL